MMHIQRIIIAVFAAFVLAVFASTFATAAELKTFKLPNGASVTVDQSGLGSITTHQGRRAHPIALFMPRGQTAAGQPFAPSDYALVKRLVTHHNAPFMPGRVIVIFSAGVSVTGAAAPTKRNTLARRPETSDGRVNDVLRSIGARTIAPLAQSVAGNFIGLSHGQLSTQLDIANAYVLDVTTGADPKTAAALLRREASVLYAEPDWYVSGMSTDPYPIPSSLIKQAQEQRTQTVPASISVAGAPFAATLPSNFGTISSLQSYLNANGIDYYGAYAEIQHQFSQLPGEGEIITNVSVGDLTDQSMADAGDQYVQANGPTTVVIGNQRFLDIPSMPLIPTFTSNPSGVLNPLGTAEFNDPVNGEILLDFSMMAPLPHNLQRPGAVGFGGTDLLGIAPGAQFRLVIPETPTISQIEIALLAAAQQQPHPNVISASLGFGFDVQGFPGRYLEEDPLAESIIASIVQNYGIVVCISANDGLRVFTPAAVGPDGGSAPTDLASQEDPATVPADDFLSSIPGRVVDSGSMDVGGSTTDDILSNPPQARGPYADRGTFAETRFNGETDFSSGFGSRVNVAAPSDNIPSLIHVCLLGDCTARTVIPVLNGGTSASAPMAAAAAAVLLQVGRLTGRTLHPEDIRRLLISSGRAVPSPLQADRALTVGRQIDLTAATEALLQSKTGALPPISPSIVRFGIAERQNIGNLGSQFAEVVNPDNIFMAGPLVGILLIPSGQNTVSPLTFAPDIVGVADRPGVRYELRVGNVLLSRDRVPRLLPAQLLAAAHLPLASPSARSLTVTYEVFVGLRKVCGISRKLTFGPNDGTFLEALAPVAQPVVPVGQDVVVHYDVTGVRNVATLRLAVSSIGHWTPVTAGLFRISHEQSLNGLSGTAVIPASAFAGGEGIYGLALIQQQFALRPVFGEFFPIRIGSRDLDDRGAAPVLSSPDQVAAGSVQATGSHFLIVKRAAPIFDVHYDVSHVRNATNAIVEISAPAPTIFGLLNTFTNQNGDMRDHNGVESPSVKYLPQFGRSGVVRLNADSLELQSSDIYGIRVLPAVGNQVIGQASAISSLEFDDGLAPGGETLYDFDIHPGGHSSVATAIFTPALNPIDAFVFPYSVPGVYGSPFAADPSGNSVFQVVGSDSSEHTDVVLQTQWFTPQQFLQGYDTRTGQLMKATAIDNNAQFFVSLGRVDSPRDRVDLLTLAGADSADQMVTASLSSLALGNPIALDVNAPGKGVFNVFDVDESTGDAIVGRALIGSLCMFRDFGVTAVNFQTNTAASYSRTANCSTGIVSDGANGKAYLGFGRAPEFDFIPNGDLQAVDEKTLIPGPQLRLTERSVVFPTYDKIHHVIVAGFLADDNYFQNNNATSMLGVIDPTSGQMLKVMGGFNFFAQVFSDNFSQQGERGIQLDPATRTGWTYGPADDQLQQFKY